MSHKDTVTPRVRHTVWVEKFDHSGDVPVRVATEKRVVENGKVVESETTFEKKDDDAPR